MNQNTRQLSKIKLIGLFFLFATLIAARRWEQFIKPNVWVEDGLIVLPSIFTQGFKALFEPVNGYLILSSKLISWIALSTTALSHYPLVSSLLTIIFCSSVCLLVALAPLKIRGGILLAFSVIFVPSNAEVFGLPLYSFWWAGLLCFVALLWEEDDRAHIVIFRIFLLFLGGLSSPIIAITIPLFAHRLWKSKIKSSECWVFLAVILFTVIQLKFILAAGEAKTQFNILRQFFALRQFFSGYLIGNFIGGKVVSYLLFPFFVILITIFISRLKDTPSRYIAFLFLASIALNAARTDLSILNPINDGPRYFFYPFILLSWLLIQAICSLALTARDRLIALLLLSLGFFNSFFCFYSTTCRFILGTAYRIMQIF